MEIVAVGKCVAIRRLEIEDVPLYTKWWNNGELMASVGFKNGLGITEEKLYQEFTKEIIDIDKYRKSRRYVVIDIKDNKPIGELVYGQLDVQERKCRIGMKICDLTYQGKGYGKNTLITFMNYLYNYFDLLKIEIDTLADNIRALSLYEKVGFKEIKYEQDFWTDPDGISHDVIFMELHRRDWIYWAN